jgi:hypothetical protein
MSNTDAFINNSLYIESAKIKLDKLKTFLTEVGANYSDLFDLEKVIKIAENCIKYCSCQKGDRVYLNKSIVKTINGSNISYNFQKYAWGTVCGVCPQENGYTIYIRLDKDWYKGVDGSYRGDVRSNCVYPINVEDLDKISIINGKETGYQLVNPNKIIWQGEKILKDLVVLGED